MTPRITKHARQRCEEMGISTKVAKQIVRHADVTHTTDSRGRECQRFVCKSDKHPGYAVAYFKAPDGVPVVCTVLFDTAEEYVRLGATFAPVTKRAVS